MRVFFVFWSILEEMGGFTMNKHIDYVLKPISIAIFIIAIAIGLAGCGAKSASEQKDHEIIHRDSNTSSGEQLVANSSAMDSNMQPTPLPSVVTPQPSVPLAVPSPAPAPVPTPASPASVKKKPSIPVQRQQEMSQKKLTLAELRSKYSDIFKVQGQSQGRKIALTFDDGPDELYTPQVLNVLKAANVKATFFLVGKRAEAHPAIVGRIAKEGHVIGNHSYNHPLFTKLSLLAFQQQINQTTRILRGQIGYSPKLIRPPYGEISEEQLKWTGDHRYMIVNWNVDSLDWKGLSAEQVSHNILSTVKSGAIVLQHSAGGDNQDLSGTVGALSTIIQKLKADGYEFVTVPQLLNIPKQL
jgi:peptidoglycan/xylan/chitin deacetylase (PgdA/CDA1 family)